jgi:2-hydroxy-3-oxopropionate reductase
MTAPRIAFIGTGRMGKPMAGHLLQAGFPVVAFDVSAAPLAELSDAGAFIADSPQAAAEAAQVVITMLPSDEALQEVVAGGLLGHLAPGQTYIDMGTSRLATSLRLATLLADRGVAMLDAPVTGGEAGAQHATLDIMVGGEAAAFQACEPALRAMGRKVTHVGGHGHGLIAKYVNQIIMEATFGIVAEAFSLASSAGADPSAVYEAIRTGGAASFVLDLAMPGVLRGEWGAGRELTLHAKDGAYALAAAEDLRAWTPFTALSHELFKLALAQGEGEHAAAAVARVYERARHS